MHLQLAQALGFIGIKYINILQNIVSTLPILEILELLVAATALVLPLIGLGTQKFHRATSTCLYILTVPITLAYVAMTMVYRWHLKATIHTWLAMRGKTPLLPPSSFSPFQKEKTEQAAVVLQPLYPTQLAVASLLFMPCVLTLPTTAWFYAFWSVLELICYGLPVTVLSAAGVAVEESPSPFLAIENNPVDLLQKWIYGHVFTLNIK